MFIQLRKELLIKYLFLFALLFACLAGICSVAFVLVTAIMICGVVMTSKAFISGFEGQVQTEAIVFDLLFRFSVSGIAIVAVGLSEGLTEWFSIIVYSVYMFCLSLKLINHFAIELKHEGEKKKKSIRDAQEAAMTLLVPAVYLTAAISSTVFSVIYHIVLIAGALSFLLKLRFKKFPKKVMLILAGIEALILILTLIFTLTGLFTV